MERGQRHDYRVYGLRTSSGLVPGLILVGVGALFFLNNLHVIYIREWLAFWPVILIAVGVVKLVDSTLTGSRVAGGVMLAAGAVLLAQSLGYIHMRMRDMWPLILIGLGVVMLFQRADGWHAHAAPMTADGEEEAVPPNGPNYLKIDAVFSGGKRRLMTQDFQGGRISTVFGGVELDLRQAGMTADSAVLEVSAVFGGVEIQVPHNWNVDIRVAGVFGGVGDHTLQQSPELPGVKHLILKGSAVFGGIEVKN